MLTVPALVSLTLAACSAASVLGPNWFGRSESLTPEISSGCSSTGTLSCGNTSAVSNLCCFEAPGFWDTSPSTGPTNSWTIHGESPVPCDTTFTENCDPSRAYTGIADLLTAQGASSTLSFMQTFWKDINGKDETFWEWSTHGTCMSTLRPTCLPSGSPKGAEAVAFFETVIKLFQTLPTFTWLSNQGITPSSSATHTLASLNAAIKAESGFTPIFGCSGSNLNSVQYYFHLRGSIIDGAFQQINQPSGESSSCPSSGIKYPLKSGSTSTTSAPGTPGLPSKATIHASSAGGLLSAGTLSTQTLATYTITGTTSSFTMTSSKGNCGISSGTFTCGSGVSSTSFSAVSSGSSLLLASGGSTSWSTYLRTQIVASFSLSLFRPLHFTSSPWPSASQFPMKIASSCPSAQITSCGNSTVVRDLCCFEAPGGLLLQTQFWDTHPATGPKDSWTIHGACNLQFAENCDPSRAYTNIAGLLSDQGADDTLDYMNTPSCLPEDSPRGAETLPTYTWLANQGITPSSTATYTLNSLNSALKSESGYYPVLDCQGHNLDSISWYFHLRGSVIDGEFVQIDAPEKGNCPSTGIIYPLKTDGGSDEPKKPKKRPSRRERRKEQNSNRDQGEL
ncbi:RNase Gf29 [Favolaschia claudopus]|uniref:RNase Gf29 n=1 Tax=Favolaschia claudopus TaxID=2862362 RepID=A0AAW0CGV7_9AGAR